ncbi:FliO/MopB family protein [Alkalibacter mobilis]|uniref:FliO/MopB family protein n=1 Tax=Alkalibacter mobilis TaxID=2787712 RepID=UPI00189CF2D4|nr:flagellar biosynthetic protein FliO [Alkalibacter mobilis]MBF7096311.1 flagellar biosynthetic protein FliO [Alkalibacter mobilis]
MDFEMFFALLQTFAALGAVIALAYVTIRFARRINQGTLSYIKIIEKMPLSNQGYLAVVKVGGGYDLIGVSGNEIKLIKELDPAEVEKIIDEKSRRLDENPLEKFIKKGKNHE